MSRSTTVTRARPRTPGRGRDGPGALAAAQQGLTQVAVRAHESGLKPQRRFVVRLGLLQPPRLAVRLPEMKLTRRFARGILEYSRVLRHEEFQQDQDKRRRQSQQKGRGSHAITENNAKEPSIQHRTRILADTTEEH